MPLVSIALQFLLTGGSRDLLHLNADEMEALLNALLPPKDSLCFSIYAIGSEATDGDMSANLELIRNHPSTIAFGIHAPDRERSCLHVHILSLAGPHEELHRLIGGGCQRVWHSAPRCLRYLDRGSNGQHSVNGVHFGPAASPELRVLVLLDHFYGRLTSVLVTKPDPGLEGAFDVAEFLHRRIQARQISPSIAAVVPVQWGALVEECVERAGRQAAAETTPGAATYLHNWSVRLSAGFARLTMEAEQATHAIPAPAYLGHAAYYRCLLAATFRLDETALGSYAWCWIAPSVYQEHRRGTTLPRMLHWHALGVGSFIHDEAALDRVREQYLNRPIPYYRFPGAVVGVRTYEEASWSRSARTFQRRCPSRAPSSAASSTA
ncbi:MAG: hypothetical protein NTW87_24105, partial [Planctomycetota bacterium]|nr:hypothetical protein [Planctomycetota bacterium]